MNIASPTPPAGELCVNHLERDPAHNAESSVLVDVPNVTVGLHKQSGGKSFELDWQRLGHDIAFELVGTKLRDMKAYDIVRGTVQQMNNRLYPLYRRLRPVGFQVLPLANRDIDGMIHAELWRVIAEHVRDVLATGTAALPFQYRFVLVSGDGGFLETINDIRRAYGPSLEIELVVYSWKRQLSKKLNQAANRIRFLDDIEEFIIPRAVAAY